MPRPRTLPALTSLRFFAALWVVLYHGMVWSGHHQSGMIGIGFLAVPFFFLLSGFILAHVYLSQGAPVQTKRFLVSRLARMYPLYALCIVLDLPHFLYTAARVTHLALPLRVASVMASFLMVQSWNTHLIGPNGPSWSLSVEAFFYLIFPFVGPALYSLRPRWALLLLFGLPFAGVAMTAMTTSSDTPTFDPLRPLPVFLMGILLNSLATGIAADQSRRSQLKSFAAPLALVCLALIIASSGPGHNYYSFLQNGLLAPAFAGLILAFSVESRMSTLFSARWLVLLGEASFGLYLIHMPLKALLRRPMETHFAILFPTYVVLVILLSIASFIYFENPARLWLLGHFGFQSRESTLASSVAQ